MRETVAIVGLGLMGGSFALALGESRPETMRIGIDTDGRARELALEIGAAEQVSAELEAAGRADVVVLAAPVRTILRQIAVLGAILADGALILDLGSTKRSIVAAMDRLPERLCAVGGHPMCGKEKSGLAAAEPGLYRDKPFVLSPSARASEAGMERAKELVRALGACPVVLDAERHDRIVAAVSHLPYLAASALVEVSEEEADRDPEVLRLAASGFRDSTRVAASDTTMMLDILLTNPYHVAGLARLYSERLAELADLVEGQEEDVLRLRLDKAAAARRALASAASPGESGQEAN